MAYADFKSYIEDKFSDYLLRQVSLFVDEYHDGIGFHGVNVLAINRQQVANLKICSVKCKDAPDPLVRIDIHLSADIVSYGLGTRPVEIGRKPKWFTVSVTANLRDGMTIKEEETNVREYSPGPLDKDNALDEFGVKYIYTENLEEIADDFTEFYCSDAVYKDYRFPFEHVMKQMELTAYYAELPGKTKGRMYFKEDSVDVSSKIYPPDPRFVSRKERIQPGTMLINSLQKLNQNAPLDDVFTKTHEIAHWEYHRRFFNILSLLGGSEALVCDEEPSEYNNSMPSLQKATWFAEWQANSIGIRIAMPQNLFRKAIHEAFEETKKTHKGEGNAEVVEATLRRVSELFGVSNYLVKQRAIQLGWDFAEGTFLYVNGCYHKPLYFPKGRLEKNQTFLIDSQSVESLKKNDSFFYKLICSGKFISLGYVVCLNDQKYIRPADMYESSLPGWKYELTDYARNHIDECCLVFNWSSRSGSADSEGFYGRNFLSRDVCADNRVEYTYDKEFKSAQSNDSLMAEVARLKAAFDAEEAVLRELPRSFKDQLVYHMDRKGITVDQLVERSKLSDTTIKKYRSGAIDPDIDNLMAVFIGLNLPEVYCNAMLSARSIILNDMDLKQRVYRRPIQEHSDGNIAQWNNILVNGFGLKKIPNRRNQQTKPKK